MSGYQIDAELARGLLELAPPASATGLSQMREQLRKADLERQATQPVSGVDEVLIENRTITRPDGGQVPIRIFTPRDRNGTMPCVLELHGGAYMVGDLERDHVFNIGIAASVGAVVVAVDYRLAPENPYPAAFDDSFAALDWVFASSEVLGIDRDRVAVAGISAGGGLAAALALASRDRGGPNIALQILIIPAVDDRMETASMAEFTDTPLFTRAAAEAMWRAYLGERHGGDVPAYAAPARAADLRGVAPAYIETALYDPLRDEGLAYAQRLMHADVPVELHQYPGTFHGSQRLPAVVTSRACDGRLAALRHALGNPEDPVLAS